MTNADRLKAVSNAHCSGIVDKAAKEEEVARGLVHVISSWRAAAQRRVRCAEEVAEKVEAALESAGKRLDEAIERHGETFLARTGFRKVLDQEVKESQECCERAQAALGDYVLEARSRGVLGAAAMEAVQEEQAIRSEEALLEIRSAPAHWF